MSFRYLSVLIMAALPFASVARQALRVCADPNNMPFSNEQGKDSKTS